MSSEPVIISLDGLAKAYRIWASPSARLLSPAMETAVPWTPGPVSASLQKKAKKGYRDFQALHPVTLQIRRGEATGIIGRNGSGKSTMLQLIAGTLTPTHGTVKVSGRVAALLELGSGFNPDFTGRENVYLNGAIHGLSRAEMDKRFAEIAAFAEIGDFIEQPVKTYSSGMLVRLAFSVAISVQPDVLIVDEALSVGDVFFAQKCFRRIREIIHRGATLIFVSHDMGAVQSLCDRALLLHQGQLVFDGAPEDCVSRYFNLNQARKPGAARAEGTHAEIDAELRQKVIEHDVLGHARSRHGDRTLEFVAAAVYDGHGAATFEYEMMHRATVRVLLRANREVRLPSVGVQIHDRLGNLVYAAGTPQLRFPLAAIDAGREVMLDFNVTLSVHPGTYTLSLDAAECDAEDPNVGTFFDRVGGLGPLDVKHHGTGAMPFYGVAQLPMEINYT
ncbi:ABC transporter ATP-binding protein [Nibricoccus sp. IMCC34717]|uniref:ABC transporter ATP-binding protein n=1 Tax=Nibricoccus sp. IMCC34717 TaxID=3034021 RepID=UPI00384C94FE